MTIFRRKPPNRGRRMQVMLAEVPILSEYPAPSRAVNRYSGKCNTLGCDGQWRVDDTSNT